MYEVKPHTEGKKSGWVVITPDGVIANDCIHETYESAIRHRDLLIAYFGIKPLCKAISELRILESTQ
jgi:hypothetical protein